MARKDYSDIAQCVRRHYPGTQALYLFGSYGTDDEHPESDVDLAVLLPPAEAKAVGGLVLGACWQMLTDLLGRPIDLINLRQTNTVLQHEIIHTARLIDCPSPREKDFFETDVMGLYQKLNQERAGIIEEIVRSGRVLTP